MSRSWSAATPTTGRRWSACAWPGARASTTRTPSSTACKSSSRASTAWTRGPWTSRAGSPRREPTRATWPGWCAPICRASWPTCPTTRGRACWAWRPIWWRRCSMLPLRVELEGFLTYRDRTVFDFQGEWLWAITGKNGAGKSAIFDAITYALYGEHRGGKQHDDPLISQGRDAACVVFEFALGPKTYRVQRNITRQYARRKITYDRTCQAYQLVCTGDAGVATPLALPGTDRKDGLEAWVVRTIGLTHGAFVSSVLLQQGRADRFVLAKPRERRDILMELLDLEIYKRLETAARAHQRRCADQISDLEAQLHRLHVGSRRRGPDAGAGPSGASQAHRAGDAGGDHDAGQRQALQRARRRAAHRPPGVGTRRAPAARRRYHRARGGRSAHGARHRAPAGRDRAAPPAGNGVA